MRTKAEKTKCNRKEDDEDSAPDAKALKLEPQPTTESSGGGGGGGSSSSSSSNSSGSKICQMCGKIHSNDDLFKYLSVLPEDERYKCHYCLESFSYSCLFAAHIRACSSAYPSTTDDSAGMTTTSTNSNPTTSVSTVTTAEKDAKNTVSASITTSNSFSSLYTNSEKIASGMDNSNLRCGVCSRIFTNRFVLVNHIERMHGGKGPTECEFCHKKYSSVVDLIIHKKTHVGLTPYQCQYCDQQFTNRSMVTEHERIHTGDTPYKCEFCNRGFSYRSNLIVHKRIHDSKRNHFECDQCGQMFQHGAQLTRHKLVHTTDKPLDCRHCGKRFVIYNKLIEHIKEEHPNKS